MSKDSCLKEYSNSDEQVTLLLEMLRSMRKAQCLSQSQVASMLDASRSHTAAIEQGKVIPRLDTYIRLLSIYGYDIDISKHQ